MHLVELTLLPSEGSWEGVGRVRGEGVRLGVGKGLWQGRDGRGVGCRGREEEEVVCVCVCVLSPIAHIAFLSPPPSIFPLPTYLISSHISHAFPFLPSPSPSPSPPPITQPRPPARPSPSTHHYRHQCLVFLLSRTYLFLLSLSLSLSLSLIKLTQGSYKKKGHVYQLFLLYYCV